MCICMYIFKKIYIYILFIYFLILFLFFWWYCFDTTNFTSSLPPLYLGTLIQEETFGVHMKMQYHVKREEATLEPTTPLKRIYTPPSIKVLFPLNQYKYSFRKFRTNCIKTYTSQYNKNMIHNLSNHSLTDDEFSVFIRGLSFVATPTKNF